MANKDEYIASIARTLRQSVYHRLQFVSRVKILLSDHVLISAFQLLQELLKSRYISMVGINLHV